MTLRFPFLFYPLKSLPLSFFFKQPDVTAPGLNILAAWSESSSPTKLDGDKRKVKYNLMSGTSMSCPHVAATAALLRKIHPNWSSAAIRSAIMTTGLFLPPSSISQPFFSLRRIFSFHGQRRRGMHRDGP